MDLKTCDSSYARLILNATSSNFPCDSNVVMHTFGGSLLETTIKCVPTRARKSIAFFEIRKENLLGLRVTCRKTIAFSLLDKLLIWVLPRLFSYGRNTGLKKNPGFSEIAEKSNQCKAFYKQNFLNRVCFTISNRSLNLFPEVRDLDLYFDRLSGFSLSCSIMNILPSASIRLRRYKSEICTAKTSPEVITMKTTQKSGRFCRNTTRFQHGKENQNSLAFQKSGGTIKKQSKDNLKYHYSLRVKRQWISAFQLPY